MKFDAQVIEKMSCDPHFVLTFTYKTDRINIVEGFVEVIREAPKPSFIFGRETFDKLKNIDTSELELELLNKLVEYLFVNNGLCRTYRGNLVLNFVRY